VKADKIVSFANKLKDSLYWWLGYKYPFVVNDEYKIELLYIDRVHQSVKIRVTNLKTNDVQTPEISNDR
jgi:hypothetical protein